MTEQKKKGCRASQFTLAKLFNWETARSEENEQAQFSENVF